MGMTEYGACRGAKPLCVSCIPPRVGNQRGLMRHARPLPFHEGKDMLYSYCSHIVLERSGSLTDEAPWQGSPLNAEYGQT
jgi:hypothetical protein